MKICSNCGIELDDTAKFCFECGGSAREGKKLCQSCQGELLDGAKFCSECGTQVGAVTLDEKVAEAKDAPTAENNAQAQECDAPTAESVDKEADCAQAPKEAEAPNIAVEPKKNRVNCILSFTFAICSLVSGVSAINDFWKTVFLYFPLMIVFLVLSKCFLRKYFVQSGEANKFTKASEILTKIALPVGIVFTCLCVFLSVISFVSSETFATLVGAIVTFFNETTVELLGK